jgi:hypothetical protein
VLGFLGSEARNFYWHTRIQDTSSIQNITIKQSYDIRNVTKKTELTFDGFPIVCWAPSGGIGSPKVMKACGAAQLEHIDTEAQVGEDACFGRPLDECATDVDTTDEGDLLDF